MSAETLPPRSISENMPSDAPKHALGWQHSANLDLLRSFAVLCVLARHALPLLGIGAIGGVSLQPLGIFGVLLFFVHTCLVLMASLDRLQAREDGKFAHLAVAFWIRRVFRIYPLSIFSVLLFTFLFPLPWRIVWPNLLLIQPFLGIPSAPTPLWSLPLEVLMYALLPGIFILTRRFGAKRVMAIWPVLFSLILIQKRFPGIPMFVAFIPCFAGGVIAFLIPRKPRWPAWILPVFLCGAVVLDMVIFGRIKGQVSSGAPFCFLLGVLLPNLQELRWQPARRVFSTIAKYSYGIYLFHTIAFEAMIPEGRVDPLVRLPFGPGLSVLCALAVSVLASVITFSLIEEPMIRLGVKVSSSLFLRVQTSQALRRAEG